LSPSKVSLKITDQKINDIYVADTSSKAKMGSSTTNFTSTVSSNQPITAVAVPNKNDVIHENAE
jgi:hypothetical protein